MGRPKKEGVKLEALSFRMTEDEIKFIDFVSAMADTNRSRFIRTAVLESAKAFLDTKTAAEIEVFAQEQREKIRADQQSQIDEVDKIFDIMTQTTKA